MVYIHMQVPCDNLEDYETDAVWGSFKYIECMGADNVDTNGNVTVTPGDTCEEERPIPLRAWK